MDCVKIIQFESESGPTYLQAIVPNQRHYFEAVNDDQNVTEARLIKVLV